MILETFKRIFTKPKPEVTDFKTGQATSTEITHCPICKSDQIKKTVWRLQGYKPRTAVRMATERYGLGVEVEYNCPCGFHHAGALFKEE